VAWLFRGTWAEGKADYGALGVVISEYMKKAGCRATKYAICEVDYTGLYNVSLLGNEVRDLFYMLRNKRGRPYMGDVSKDFVKEVEECSSTMLYFGGSSYLDLLSEDYAVHKGSVLGNSKFTVKQSMFVDKVPNVIDVSSGTPKAIRLSNS
jgi:hypothetical protein